MWQTVITLCDSLEYVFCFFRDVKNKKYLGQMNFFYSKLKQFKYIYILYILVDILHFLALLSMIFLKKL